MSDLELEELKRKKLLELQEMLMREREMAELEARREATKEAIMRRILTPEARQRLRTIKLVKPEFVEELENQLIQAASEGTIKIPITEEQLKTILGRLSSRREIRIRIRRK